MKDLILTKVMLILIQKTKTFINTCYFSVSLVPALIPTYFYYYKNGSLLLTFKITSQKGMPDRKCEASSFKGFGTKSPICFKFWSDDLWDSRN